MLPLLGHRPLLVPRLWLTDAGDEPHTPRRDGASLDRAGPCSPLLEQMTAARARGHPTAVLPALSTLPAVVLLRLAGDVGTPGSTPPTAVTLLAWASSGPAPFDAAALALPVPIPAATITPAADAGTAFLCPGWRLPTPLPRPGNVR